MSKINLTRFTVNDNEYTAKKLDVIVDTLSDCLAAIRKNCGKTDPATDLAFETAQTQLSELNDMKKHFAR